MLYKSLIVRVILLNILLMAVGIGIFTLVNVRREQVHLIESNQVTANLLLATIEKSIFTAMKNGDSPQVQQIIEVVGKGDRLLNLRIFHPDGTILKSANPHEIGRQVNLADFNVFQEGRSEATFRVNGRDAMTVIRPILTDERCYLCHGVGRRVVGVLNMNFDLTETIQLLHESANVAFSSMLILISLFSLGITFILLRFVRQPIQEMAAQMAKVENGDLSVRLTPRNRDEMGQLMGSFNSMVDNLEQTKIELEKYHYQQMERADRLAAVGEMSTGIAHEIKNPLACISGAISVLADDYGVNDPRREVVTKVLEQISRLDKTATDLLAFGKPGTPEFSYVDINELLKKTLFFVAQHPEARNVERILELTRELPPVWIDIKQIQQVFFNIIINAIQAMPEGGTLTLTTDSVQRDEGEFVRVTIRDTGKGIEAEVLAKIFVPFFTTKMQGTGLGLPICRQLVEHNHGSIEVESSCQQGTTFSILLPAASLSGDLQE
ncbi:MAG: ATP-binding protein [Desulfuromonadales bacterium]|nr:ATP-binding protein [Desulfuromonadales bacterium]